MKWKVVLDFKKLLILRIDKEKICGKLLHLWFKECPWNDYFGLEGCYE